MKRGILFFFAAIAVILIFSSCSEKIVSLKLAEVHTSDYPTSLAVKEFARLVEEKTQGRVVVEVHTDSRLFDDEADSVHALQTGELDFARVSGAFAAALSPKLNLVQLPFFYKDGAHQVRVLSSDVGREILSSISDENSGVACLCWYDSGARSFYLKKEVHSVEELAGLKIRVQQNPVMNKMCELLGATGVQGISTNDVYRNLLNGMIDGAENNLPTYQNVGDYQAAMYYIRDEHTRIPDLLLVSKKAIEKLSAEDVEIIKNCALETESFERELWAEKEKTSEKIIREAGNVIVDLTDDEKSSFSSAIQPIYDDFEKKYPDLFSQIKNIE